MIDIKEMCNMSKHTHLFLRFTIDVYDLHRKDVEIQPQIYVIFLDTLISIFCSFLIPFTCNKNESK